MAVMDHARNLSNVWGASTSKDVQDLRAYIANMAFSPHEKEQVSVLDVNQDSMERKLQSRKVLHDRTNQNPFPEIVPIDKTPIDGLYFNGGWCYGGFKATPASGFCYAHLLATDTPHKVATAFRLDRFRSGAMIDEKGVGAQPNLH